MKLALVTLPLLLASLATSSLRAADDSPLFSDDFATLDHGWGEANDSKRVQDKQLILEFEPQVAMHVFNDQTVPANIDISLKVSLIKGNTSQQGGIAFWATDHDNFYMARVSADGRLSVGRRMRGKWLKPVFGQPREEIIQGLGQVNEVRVVTCGRTVTIYVNDKKTAEFQGYPPQGNSKFGVYAESGDDPARWAFSEMTVRRGPPSPDAESKSTDALLLADDFVTLDPAWGSISETMKVEDGKLVMNLKPDIVRTSLYEGSLFENVDVRLKIAEAAGGTDQAAGIVFWATNYDNGYSALIQADGGFYVARHTRGKWLNPVAFRTCKEVQKGLGQVNELRVVTRGRTATIYVNDKQVASFQGFPPTGGAKIGLHAESGADAATWAFSELRIRQGEPPRETAAPADEMLLVADDFAALEPAWGIAGDSESVRDNKLWIQLEPGDRYTNLYQGMLFDDVDMSVKVAAAKGWTDQFPGLMFWANGLKDYCAFVVNPEGDVYSGRILNGKWKGMNILKSTQSKLRRGAGEVSELRVVTSGTSAILYINGQKAHTYKGEPPEGGSRIGLRVETNDDPAACAFSEFRVRTPLVTLETSGARTDGLLLTDDFRALQPTWGPATDYQSVSGHRLLLSPEPKSSRSSFYPGNVGNAEIQVKVAQVKGNPDVPGGIIFWATADMQDYYVALVRPDGGFCVVRHSMGLWLHPVPLQRREEVRQGAGQINELRVVTSGRTASVSLNGREVTSFRGFPPKGGGWIGFFAEAGIERSTWAFSELSVRKGPESPDDKTPPDEALLFADDFHVLDPAWSTTENWVNVNENNLTITPQPDRGCMSLYGGRLFGDADIRVKIRQSTGNTDVPAGILFWAALNRDTFLAKICSDGRFDVLRNAGGQSTPIVRSKVLDEVLKGMGQVNELRVVTRGKTATVYVNEKEVATLETDALPKGGSRIGLFAGSGSEACSWSFSDLVVRKPE